MSVLQCCITLLLRKETHITVILMTVVFIVFVNSLEKLLWTCIFCVSTHGQVTIHWPNVYITMHIWTQKTVIYSSNYHLCKNNLIGAQQIGSKYEDMVFIDWYTFWNSAPFIRICFIALCNRCMSENSSVEVMFSCFFRNRR